jgi:hypothetical protein
LVLTRRVSSVEQELLTLPERHEFTPVRVTRSLVLSVCFVDRCLSFILWRKHLKNSTLTRMVQWLAYPSLASQVVLAT